MTVVMMTRRGAADVVVARRAAKRGGFLAEPEGAAVPVLLPPSGARPLVGAVAPERNMADFTWCISSLGASHVPQIGCVIRRLCAKLKSSS